MVRSEGQECSSVAAYHGGPLTPPTGKQPLQVLKNTKSLNLYTPDVSKTSVLPIVHFVLGKVQQLLKFSNFLAIIFASAAK